MTYKENENGHNDINDDTNTVSHMLHNGLQKYLLKNSEKL